MNRFWKFFADHIYSKLVLRYINKDTSFTHERVKIVVKKGVFHPAFFFSTKLLLQEIKKHQLKNKKLLELGAGSGIISFVAASRGAEVWATDISHKAIEGLTENMQKLPLPITVIQSDLFQHIPHILFDYIFINPPYYARNPLKEEEYAWFCGSEYEYYQKLFSQVKQRNLKNCQIIMVLSETANCSQIEMVAELAGCKLIKYRIKRIWWERNYLYKLEY
jgi:release factor glutamine methyltransferase